MFPWWKTWNQENSRAVQRNAGNTASSSTVSGTWLWKSVGAGKSGISAGPVRTCGRSAQPNRPTSIWANDDECTACGPSGPRSRSPRWCRCHAPARESRPSAADPKPRSSRSSRPMPLIQPSGARVASDAGVGASGAQAATRVPSTGRPGRQQADEAAAGHQHAHRPDHARTAIRGHVGHAPDRAVPRKTAPKTLTKQATASPPTKASAGAAKAAVGQAAPAPIPSVPNRPR